MQPDLSGWSITCKWLPTVRGENAIVLPVVRHWADRSPHGHHATEPHVGLDHDVDERFNEVRAFARNVNGIRVKVIKHCQGFNEVRAFARNVNVV